MVRRDQRALQLDLVMSAETVRDQIREICQRAQQPLDRMRIFHAEATSILESAVDAGWNDNLAKAARRLVGTKTQREASRRG